MDVGIASYQFTLNKAHSTSQILNITDKVFDNGTDLLDYVYANIEHFIDEFNLNKQNTTIEKAEPESIEGPTIKKAISSGKLIKKETVKKSNRDYYKYIYFTVECGEYGAKALIKDIDTAKTDFVQGDHHAAMRPFHILLAITCDKDTEHGIILYERIGALGIKSIITPIISSLFASSNYPATFSVKPIVQLDYIDTLLKTAPLESLRLVKYFENNDKSDRPFCSREERLYVRPLLADYRTQFHNIANMGKCTGTGIAIIDRFAPDSVRVTLNVHNREKTIELTSIDSVSFTEFFNTKNGIIFEEGLPTDDSLLPLLLEIVEERIAIIS